MDYTTRLMSRLIPLVEEQIRSDLEQGEPRSISEMERRVQRTLQDVGAIWLREWMEEMDGAYPQPHMPCSCGEEAEYVRRREGVIITLLGRVNFRRAYYLCPHCHHGQYGLDQRLGYQTGCLTPEVTSTAGRIGAEIPFERARDLLEELTGVSLSENSVRDATQEVGAEVVAQEEESSAESRDAEVLLAHDRLPPEEKPDRLYGSVDGIKVPVDGEWRELKVGCWHLEEHSARDSPAESDKETRATEISYYCDFLEAERFGYLTWATGCQRLADQAKELVFVADGAAWIWKLVQTHFPQAIQIVDWYHAVEYIAPIAKAAFGEEGPESQAWQDRVRTDLWEGRFDRVLSSFEELLDHPTAGEAARKAWNYYTNNRKRMRYAEFRTKGLRIGSGTVESGCKQIGTQRLKVAGARWSLEGARTTAKARAALLSNQWASITARLGCLPLAA